MAGAGPDQDTAEDLHAGRQISDMHKDRGGLDDDTPGTRLARLRQAVGDGLRGLSKGIERVRGTLDDQGAEPDGWIKEIKTLIGCASDLQKTVKVVKQLHDNPRLRAPAKILHARFLAVAILLRKFDKAKEK